MSKNLQTQRINQSGGYFLQELIAVLIMSISFSLILFAGPPIKIDKYGRILNAASEENSNWISFTCPSGLISNGDFESNFTDWDFFTNTNITTDAYFGTKAARTSGGAGGVGANKPAAAGEVYSLEVFAKKTGSESAVVGIKFLDAGYNELKSLYEEVHSTSYQAFQLSAIAPLGAVYVQAMAWKNTGTGTATFDGFCLQKWNVPAPSCPGQNCVLTPSWGNYVWAMDDSGTNNNWKDYDLGGLVLCNNGNGTLTVKGNIINGHDSDWHVSNGTSCGAQDGWFLQLTLSDRKTWSGFQGNIVQHAGCASNHPDWDYWQIAGTLTGTGCNTGRTINVHSSASGYQAQVGWGGNSQSCDFGISTWLDATENGQPVQADLYAHFDAYCYYSFFPEDCVNGTDDDGDGLVDCFDTDCAPQLLQNQSFENAGTTVFNTTFQGNPAKALPNNSNMLPSWVMDYGCGSNCYDSYWINDLADVVNNPDGDYFVWIPGSSYCARQSITVDISKCYEVTIVAAAWSVPGPQSPTTIEIEAFGGGISNNGGLLSLFSTELPTSSNWQNLNWQTLKFLWSPPVSATTSIYISQNNTSVFAKGIAVDKILIKEICCNPGVEICGNGIDDDGDGHIDNADQDCLCPDIYTYDETEVEICSGKSVTFATSSNAPNPPYGYIEFYRFDAPQANPYISNDPKVWLGEYANVNNGTGSITSSDFQANGNSDRTYYVYGCVKPEPQDPTTCYPLIEYVVVVKPGTLAAASADATVCSGVATNIGATATGGPAPHTFLWDQGLGAGANHTVTPSLTTTYTVTVTNGAGCTDQDLVIVSVMESPSADAGTDGTICLSQSTTLQASGTGGTTPYSFQWSHGLGTGGTKTVSPAANTAYTVTVTSDNGCSDSDQVQIAVAPCTEVCTNGIDDDGDGLADCSDPDCKPLANAGNNGSICIGSAIFLNASAIGSGEPFTYLWSHSLGSGAVKNVSPTTTTTFMVTVTNVAGCTGTAAVTVTVNNCSEVCADGIDNDGDGLTDCQDPDCSAVGAPSLQDDAFTTCPTLPFTDRVNFNDLNLQNPVYSIFSNPSSGTLSMDVTGKFTYTPLTVTCGTDAFIYQVCNQTTGCCATAGVVIHVGDTTPPLLMNVPADITIGCDETVPNPNVVLAFDECPGIYVDFDEISGEHGTGGCEGYAITRTWTAEDLCGNTVTQNQIITVQDLVGPELFRVYTLPSGKKLVAGVSKRTSHHWKYVPFPAHFSKTPLVFSQIVSNAELSAVVPQLRNVSKEGFQLRLREQEAFNGEHSPEQVAWLAIEPDTSNNLMEGGLLAAVNNIAQSLNLDQTFPNTPHFFFSSQSVNETDPFSMRVIDQSPSSTQLFLDEETSKDAETAHANESVAYLTVAPGQDLLDNDGDFIAETGLLNLTNAWATVPFHRAFNKPVVIMGGISNNDTDPVTVRVRNVAATGFEVRLQEWDSQDGAHGLESVPYLVVEGGLPGDPYHFCSTDDFKFKPGVNVFVRDNCDGQVALGFDEITTMQPDGLRIIRQWSASDDCGNSFTFEREDNCTVAALRLKSILYGAMMDAPTSLLMSDQLRAKNLLPAEEPYSHLSHFQHKGKGGGETLDSALLLITGDHALTDWLFLEIRDSADARKVLATQSVLLKRNGEVVNQEGGDVIYFPNLREGSYRVAYRHRNHLGLMVGQPWRLSSVNIPNMDLTNPNTPIFDKETSSTIINGKRAVWAGDMDGNRKVIYQGPNNDIFYLFSKVLADPANIAYLANFIAIGYDRTDMDMDGRIIYQGPDNERAKLLYHTVLSHPLNRSFLANYIVLERLP